MTRKFHITFLGIFIMFIEGWLSSRSDLKMAAKKIFHLRTKNQNPLLTSSLNRVTAVTGFHRCYMHKQTNKDRRSTSLLSPWCYGELIAFPTLQICLHMRYAFFIICLCFISAGCFTFTKIDDRSMFTN